MAISATLLNAGASELDASTYTSGLVTFTANRPVVLLVGALIGTGDIVNPTVSSPPAGVSFERVFTWVRGGEETGSRKVFVFCGKPTVNETDVVTIDFGGQTQQAVAWQFIELSGPAEELDADNPILQIQASTDSNFATSTLVNLSDFNNAVNGTLLMGLKGDIGAATAEAGWTKLADTALDIAAIHSFWNPGNDKTATASWTESVHHLFVALEFGKRTAGTTNLYSIPRGKGFAGAVASATTGTLRLRAGQVALVWVQNRVGSGTPNTPTITAPGLTVTQVATRNTNPATARCTLFRALVGASDFEGALTIDYGGQAQSGSGWVVELLGGADTGGTNGANAIRQSAANGGQVSSLTITLAAFASAANRTVAGFVVNNNTTTTTAEAGYAVTDDHPVASPIAYRIFVETLGSSDTTPSVALGAAVQVQGIAAEIVPAPEPTTTVVGRSLEALWHTRGTAGRARVLLWDAREVVARSRALRWDVRSRLARTLEARWHVRSAVARTWGAVWHVTTLVGYQRELRWSVRALVGRTRELRWQVIARAARSLVLRWRSGVPEEGGAVVGYSLRQRAAVDGRRDDRVELGHRT